MPVKKPCPLKNMPVIKNMTGTYSLRLRLSFAYCTTELTRCTVCPFTVTSPLMPGTSVLFVI